MFLFIFKSIAPAVGAPTPPTTFYIAKGTIIYAS